MKLYSKADIDVAARPDGRGARIKETTWPSAYALVTTRDLAIAVVQTVNRARQRRSRAARGRAKAAPATDDGRTRSNYMQSMGQYGTRTGHENESNEMTDWYEL